MPQCEIQVIATLTAANIHHRYIMRFVYGAKVVLEALVVKDLLMLSLLGYTHPVVK